MKLSGAELSITTMCAGMCLQVRVPRRRRSPRALQQQLRREPHSPVRALRHTHVCEKSVPGKVGDREPQRDAEDNIALRDCLRLTADFAWPMRAGTSHLGELCKDANLRTEHAPLSAVCLVQGGLAAARRDPFNTCTQSVHAHRFHPMTCCLQ